MTSTKFNVGLSEARSSSRVLRPPGGGHSDIFGISEEPQQQAKRIMKQSNASSIIFDDISEKKQVVTSAKTEVKNAEPEEPKKDSSVEAVVNNDEPDEPKKDAPVKAEVKNIDSEVEILNGNDVKNGEQIEEPKKEAASAPQQRKRVPPGGYSSGLW